MNIYRKVYDWEDREVSSLAPGDILVECWNIWRRDHPTAVVVGSHTTGAEVVPDQGDARDLIFIPIHDLQIQWTPQGKMVYVEDDQDREKLYQVFPSLTHMVRVAKRKEFDA